MVCFSSRVLALTALLLAVPACSSEALAAGRQQALVDRAALTVQDIFDNSAPDSRAHRLLGQARAVMVCPSIFRMSIGIGGSGGGCVLVSRDARGSWSDPAFYTMSSGSIGIQLGMDDSEVMLFVMSARGLQALLDSQFSFNAGASASFATLGSGVEDGTAGVANTDILAVQKSHGLFAGASLGGSKLTVNSAANRSYYNQPVGPEDIVVTMRVNNPGADPLRRILAQVSPAATAGVSSTAALPNQPVATAPAAGNASPYPSNYDSKRAYNAQVQAQPLGPAH